MTEMTEELRIEQLSKLVGRALEAGPYEGQSSGRVRDVPDVRTIRYYTTLGLLAPPLEMRGRTAYYGRRHLLQLVAIKRLQTRGHSLVEIQKALAGAGEKRLAEWAELPAGFFERFVESPAARAASGGVDAPAPERIGGGSRGTAEGARFWAATPEVGRGASVTAVVPRLAARDAVVLRIDDGVSLLLEDVDLEAVDEGVLGALEPVLGMLRGVLAGAGLIQREPRGASDDSNGC